MRKGIDWYRRPEMILADLLREAARGKPADRTVRRALVLAVDYEGGLLQNPDGSGQYESVWPGQHSQMLPAIVGPNNPKGSIKARILTDGLDRFRPDDDVRVYWPLFSPDHLGIPVSPGEHVYVMFEGSGLENGFWIGRVPGHESAGAFIGNRSYTAKSAPGSAMDHFDENPSELDTSDSRAGLAPGKSAVDHFDGED